jgi:hypothetical protein
MSANPRNYPVSLLLAATVGVLGGCSDSPTEPDDTLSFSGAVLATASTSHAVTAADSEVWRIEAISLVQTLADGTVTNPSAILPGIRLGSQTNSVCAPTSPVVFLAPGQSITYRVDPGDHCVLLSDSGIFPVGSKIDYVIELDIERF